MPQVLFRYLFWISIAVLAPLEGWAQNRCVDIFATREAIIGSEIFDWSEELPLRVLTPQVRELLTAGKPQEAAWMMMNAGHAQESQFLMNKIEAQLLEINKWSYTPKQWSDRLDTQRNLHVTYLLRIGTIRGVLKFGRRPWITEALAYKMSQLLKVKVPVSVAVEIEGHKGSFQYFVEDAKTGGSFTKKYDFDANLQIQFFDRLVNNWDRSYSNFLVLGTVSKPVVNRKDLDKRDQIAIDNEKLLESRDAMDWLKTSQRPFIAENIKELKRLFPETAEALAQPETAIRLIEMINASGVTGSKKLARHAEEFLTHYRELY